MNTMREVIVANLTPLRHLDTARRQRTLFQHVRTSPLSCNSCRSRHISRAAASQSEGGLFDSAKRLAKQVQGALPIVGLLSRLATPEGGIGFDELSYPEFCRKLYDTAGPEFVESSRRWEAKFGKAGQRLRVTQDIEIEMDRFEGLRNEKAEGLHIHGPPRGEAAGAAGHCGGCALSPLLRY
eukprot:jgi/Botrbrau1/22691/Bobra.0132s0032.1